jgi:hypothetical protein
MPARAPTARAIAISGTAKPIPKCVMKLLKACMTPAVKLMWFGGITHAIASVGKMKTANTSAIATKIDFG